MLIRTHTEFLSFLVLDINILVNQSGNIDVTVHMLHHCSLCCIIAVLTGTNWIDLDRSELSGTFHNIASCIISSTNLLTMSNTQ